MIDHHSKAETIIAKLFFTCENLYFVNEEVSAGCPKLGHTTLYSVCSIILKYFFIKEIGKNFSVNLNPNQGFFNPPGFGSKINNLIQGHSYIHVSKVVIVKPSY